MPRDERAYLTDILESCDAIGSAVRTLNLVDDALVWAIVETDVPVLQRECAEIMERTALTNEEGGA